MAIFREVFFEGYTTYNNNKIYEYKILQVIPNCGIGSMYFLLHVLMGMCNFCLLGILYLKVVLTIYVIYPSNNTSLKMATIGG
jgi:hypothetical protein